MARLAVMAAAAAAVAGVSAQGSNPAYTLQLVENAIGGVCLDGSNPGFYWYPSPSGSADQDKFIIYHEGGGWCYNPDDCLGRSFGRLGSSKTWAPTMQSAGLMSNDCEINPLFCNWNKVYMKYCDGFSFSGNRDQPLVVNGTSLYMRGARVLDALLEAVAAGSMKPAPEVPIAKASRVLLTGCSAGGLATYLHADYVKAKLATLYTNPAQDYRVASISGAFQNYQSVNGAFVYGNEIATAFAMQNVSGGHTNSDCLAYYSPKGAAWKCGMAPYVYPFIKAPFFALNSLYDSWQTGCVLTPEPVFNPDSEANGNCSATPGWEACAKDPTQCTASQLSQGYLPFGRAQLTVFQSAPKFNAAGSGGFLTSCHTHCEANNDAPWDQFAINNVTMRQAVAAWMGAPATAAPQWHVDCAYNPTPGAGVYCNPTCK